MRVVCWLAATCAVLTAVLAAVLTRGASSDGAHPIETEPASPSGARATPSVVAQPLELAHSAAAPPVASSVRREPVRELGLEHAVLNLDVRSSDGPVVGALVTVTRGEVEFDPHLVLASAFNVTEQFAGERNAPGPSATTDELGSAEVDISALFESTLPGGLWLRVDVNGEETNHFELALPRAQGAARTLARRMPLVLLPRCSVSAIALAPENDDDSDATRLSLLKLRGLDAFEPVRGDARNTWRPGERRFALECGVTYALLCVAPNRRPLSMPVVAAGHTRLGELALDPGCALSGRVQRNGAPVRGEVLVTLLDAKAELWVGGAALTKWQGSLEHASVLTTTAADGAFRIEGLAPARYRVRVGSGSWVVQAPHDFGVLRLYR